MRFAGIVQDQTSQFHPGVRLEPPRLFSSTDAQLDRNPAPAKKPPQHQRPLETADVKNEMPTNRVLDARDLARGCNSVCIRSQRGIRRVRSQPHEQNLPTPEP